MTGVVAVRVANAVFVGTSVLVGGGSAAPWAAPVKSPGVANQQMTARARVSKAGRRASQGEGA